MSIEPMEFKLKIDCPKCKNWSFDFEYQKEINSEKPGVTLGEILREISGEHLKVTCVRCGYVLYMRTADHGDR